MRLYRYSPITDQDELFKAAIYIADSLSQMSKYLVSKELPVKTIKIFAHYPDEYKNILSILGKLGNEHFTSHTSTYVKLNAPLQKGDHSIQYLGVRVPDPYRGQVGCGDFELKDDYAEFRAKYAEPSGYVRDAEGHTLEMLEFWHPDHDVLGYVLAGKSNWYEG